MFDNELILSVISDIYTITPIWREDMLQYLSADIICSEKQTVFRERSSNKTMTSEEEITSKNKCLSIFFRKIDAIELIILHFFFAAPTVSKLNLGNI